MEKRKREEGCEASLCSQGDSIQSRVQGPQFTEASSARVEQPGNGLEFNDGALPTMEDNFFEDFDLCPSLEDLLQDPLLEEEWPYLDENRQQAVPSGGMHQSTGNDSSHSIIHVSTPQGDIICKNETERSSQSSMGEQNGSSIATQSRGGLSSADSTLQRAGSPEESSPATADSEEEKKKIRRMQRNRESASLSRERKKLQMADKDKQLSDMQAHLSNVSALATQLGQENAVLRQEVTRLCQQFGQPLPQCLGGCYPLQAPAAAVAYGQPALAMHVPVQKVAIQRMPVSRPAPAASASQIAARAPKRRKQQAIAGGTTAMAALFCFLYFSGMPLSPSSRFDAPNESAYLPILDEQLHNSGRVLESVGVEDGEEVTSKWLAPADGNGSASLVIQPFDLETESKALQHLKDIGPVAVFSKYDTHADQFSAPAPWKSLTSLADSALAKDGISKSSRCEKVFSVDVSAVEDPEAAQRQLQRYMAQATSFKGRFQALALPPAGKTLPALNTEAEKANKSRLNCEDSADEDYIISVMMPTKDQLEGYTEISKMYVVVLNPNKKYTTYACGLERPILI